MESPQQRALHKLYHAKAILVGVRVQLVVMGTPTGYAAEEYDRVLGAIARVEDAIYLLQYADQVEPEFQITLPW